MVQHSVSHVSVSEETAGDVPLSKQQQKCGRQRRALCPRSSLLWESTKDRLIVACVQVDLVGRQLSCQSIELEHVEWLGHIITHGC